MRKISQLGDDETRTGMATSRGKARVDKERTGCSLQQGLQGSDSEGRGRKLKGIQVTKPFPMAVRPPLLPGGQREMGCSLLGCSVFAGATFPEHLPWVGRRAGDDPPKTARKTWHALGSQEHVAAEQS